MGFGAKGARYILFLAISALACAPRGTLDELGEPIIDRGDLDTPPTLLGCPGYAEPPAATARSERVSVSILVGSDGRVHEVDAPRRVTSPADVDVRLSEAARERAAELAWNCAFEPALFGGQPVAARHSVSFRFAS
ncbi:MAG: hypothetical protein AB7N70_27780 [Dehalococcoidia bacterium]